MQIHLIWAQDINGGIGKKGQLPWYIAEDLQNFKQLTLGSTIVMGKNTWQSLPIRPLSKRRNIVLSSKQVADVECYTSIEKCIEQLEGDAIEKLFVIGGATIYQNFFHRADELHITEVDKMTKGIDTYFPITLQKIQQEFEKTIEKRLGENVIYSNWVKI